MILRPHIALTFFALAVLGGCAQLTGQRPDPIETELKAEKPLTNPVPVHKVPPEDQPVTATTPKSSTPSARAKAALEPGTGRLLNYEAANAAPGTGRSGGSADETTTLNFENQPIQAVVQAILGAWLNENYSISPSVTGNVTFSTSKPISSMQALPVLEMLLAWTNNALVRKTGGYQIMPIKDAVAGNLTLGLGRVPRMLPGYQLRVFPLRYISATEMQKLLKPYAKDSSIVSADNARGMIVLAGTGEELQSYGRTIDIFDVDWLKGMSVGVFGLRNVDITKIMPDLDKFFGPTAETPLAGMFRFIPMESTNSVIVITSQPEYLKRAEEWLYRLDTGAGANGTQLYVYDVKNIKAADLADHLSAVFTTTGGKASGSKSGSTAPGSKPVNIGGLSGGIGSGSGGGSGFNSAMGLQQSAPKPPTPSLSTTGAGAPNGAGKQESDIRITAVDENNQVLTMATPGEYEQILAVIHRLDIPPLQVQLSVKVLEVTLTGDLNYGVQWWFAGLINTTSGASNSATGYTYTNGINNFNNAPNLGDRHRGSLGGGGVANPANAAGVFWSYLNKNFQVALNALQTSGQLRVLNEPSLVVLNNEEAQINVGTQIPISQTSVSTVGLTGSSNYTGISSVQYINTGTTLDITPRVNPGGLVYMQVAQEVSTPGTPAPGDNNPPINQRQLQTQVAVQSGETVLLGGLIQDQLQTSNTGVPFLKNIPWVGNLFSNTTNSSQRTELLLLITPQVITNGEDARIVTDEYQKKFESLAPLRKKEAEESGRPVPEGTSRPPAASTTTPSTTTTVTVKPLQQ